MYNDLRAPAVAGTFYPSDRSELKELVNGYLQVEDKLNDDQRLIALVSPHAGLIYSGHVAGHGYGLLKNSKIRKVVILAPSHHERITGGTIYDGDAYSTPLGDIPVEKELSAELANKSDFLSLSSKGHGPEHSLEVQLPFLQSILGDGFELVPVIIGYVNPGMASEISSSITEIISEADEEVLLIASTDLSHFHDQKQANLLDGLTADHIERMSIDELYDECEAGNCEACGINPLMIVMKTSQQLGASNSKVLKYATSGDVTGDFSSVVGYLSAAITG